MWDRSFTRIEPRVAGVALLLAACHRTPPATTSEPLKVAAAADLSFAFKDLGEAYEKATGQKVVFSFGATGLLEKQIAEGGPFDAFAAANVSFADDAVKAGACIADSKAIYATGHLVMFTTKDAPVQPKTLADLTDAHVS